MRLPLKNFVTSMVSRILPEGEVLFQRPLPKQPSSQEHLVESLANHTDKAGKTDKKTISLTFNDGPTPFGTAILLNILEQHHAKATFFLLGKNVIRYPHLVMEILNAGHQIGSHSFSHIDPWKSPTIQTVRDIMQSVEVIEQLSAKPLELFRPPFGHFTPRQVAWSSRYGMKTVLSSVSVADNSEKSSAKRLTQRLLKDVEDRSIVCLHDNPIANKITPQVLCESLPLLIDQGYQFETLDFETLNFETLNAAA